MSYEEAPSPCPTCGHPLEPEYAERLRERLAVTWSQAINDWQLTTFGPGTPQRAWARFEEELEELIEADCEPSEPDAKLAEEAADVVITLVGWLRSRCPDFDLAEAVERKMAINRARKWDVKDGVGYHIKPGDPERTGGAE